MFKQKAYRPVMVKILDLRSKMEAWSAAGTGFDVFLDGQLVARSYLTENGLSWVTCRGFYLRDPEKRQARNICKSCGQEVCS